MQLLDLFKMSKEKGTNIIVFSNVAAVYQKYLLVPCYVCNVTDQINKHAVTLTGSEIPI